MTEANFVTNFVADCVTDFNILLFFKLAGKSFGVTQALYSDLFIMQRAPLKTETIPSYYRIKQTLNISAR